MKYVFCDYCGTVYVEGYSSRCVNRNCQGTETWFGPQLQEIPSADSVETSAENEGKTAAD